MRLEGEKKLWKTLAKLIFCFLLFFSFGNMAQASFNPQINYQGKLTKPSNALVPDDSYNMKFRLCDDASCTTEIWSETRDDADMVPVANGLFSVMLGDVSDISAVNFNQTLYLEVSIGGTSTPAWEIMLPRKKFGAVPAAFEAQKLGGKASSEYAVLANNETVSGTWAFSSSLSVQGTSTFATSTTFQGSTASLQVGEISTPAGKYMYLTANSPSGVLGEKALFMEDRVMLIGQTRDPSFSLYSVNEEELKLTVNSSTNVVYFTQADEYNFDSNLVTSGTVTATGGNSTNWNTAYGWGNHADAGYLTNLLGGLNGIFGNTTTTNATSTSLYVSGNTVVNTNLTVSGESAFNATSTWDYVSSSIKFSEYDSPAGKFPMITFTSDNLFGNKIVAMEDSLFLGGLDKDPSFYLATNGVNFKLTVNSSTDQSFFSDSAQYNFDNNLNVTGIVTATGGNSTNWNSAYGWGNHADAGYLTNLLGGLNGVFGDTTTTNATTTSLYVSGNATVNTNLTVNGESAFNATSTWTYSSSSIQFSELSSPAGKFPKITFTSDNVFGNRLGLMEDGLALLGLDKDPILYMMTSDVNFKLTVNSSTDQSFFSDSAQYSFDNGVSITGNATTTSLYVSGDATVNTNLTVNGTSTIASDLVVDTNTLYVDSANNKVGIGTSTPQNKLDVVSGLVKIYEPMFSLSSSTNASNTIQAFDIQGKYAYVSAGDELRIYNIGNPSSPRLISTTTLPGTAVDDCLKLYGKRLYVATNSYEIDVYNIDSPSLPVFVSSSTSASSKTITGLGVGNNLMFIGTNFFTWQAYSLANPDYPNRVFSSAGIGGSPTKFRTAGNILYFNTSKSANDGWLYIFDMSNPAVPAAKAVFDVDGSNLYGLDVVNGMAAVGSQDNNLYLLDVSSSTNPVALDSINGGGDVLDIKISNSVLYLVTSASVVRAYDISDPTDIKAMDSVDTGTNGDQINLVGNTLITSESANLYLYNVGGLDSYSISSGDIRTDNLRVSNMAYFMGDMRIYGALAVNSGINTNGIINLQSNSNTSALRMIGATSNDIADIYVGQYGDLNISTQNTGNTGAYIELNAADDSYGLIIRNSSSTAGTNFANLYMNDITGTDYFNIVVGTQNSTAGLVVDSSQRVGLGTTTPGAQLHVVNVAAQNSFLVEDSASPDATPFVIDAAGLVGIGTTTPAYALDVVGASTNVARFRNSTLGATCTLTSATGIIACSSDLRLKKDIEVIYNPLDLVLALNPVSFYWKKDESSLYKNYGFIAQEVEQVIPELVQTGDDGMKSLAMDNMIPFLVGAVKEQQIQITSVKESLASLAVQSSSTGDIQNLDVLTVTQSANFFGTITVVGEAGFTSKVTFMDHVYFDKDSAGTAKILAGATSTEVIFGKPYETVPIINITARANTLGKNYWVENETTTGFRIAVDNSFENDFEFNWQAVAVVADSEPVEEVVINPSVGEVIPETIIDSSSTVTSTEEASSSPEIVSDESASTDTGSSEAESVTPEIPAEEAVTPEAPPAETTEVPPAETAPEVTPETPAT
ncbi:MAG: tail fiber domain-containing protein [Patescibacteria group bacterium]|jgi:hypothetical protein